MVRVLSVEKGVTDICSTFFNFSVTKNVIKSLLPNVHLLHFSKEM